MKPFVVELNLSKDEEIRTYIKQLINEQVKSVTREEIKDIVNEEVRRKLVSQLGDRNFYDVIKHSISEMCVRAFSRAYNSYDSIETKIYKLLNERCEQRALEIMSNIKINNDEIVDIVKDKVKDSLVNIQIIRK